MSEDGLDGRPLEEAVDVVVEAGRAPDREAAEATLSPVAEGGAVTRDGVASALAAVELPPADPLEAALADATAAAAPEADRPVVGSRLSRFEARVEELDVERRELAERRATLRDRVSSAGDLFSVARGVRQLAEMAATSRAAVEDCRGELAAFEDWLGDPAVRYRELAADAEALGEALDHIEESVDALAAARGQGRETSAEFATAWFDTAIRHRAMAVMLADLRWELTALREWATHPSASGIEASLDELAARREALGEGVSDVADLQLIRRFSDALSSVDAALAALSPPVAWTAVEETLAAHRAEALEDGR